MRNIFIPIKENSNRVPNKNFRAFGNKSLYEHTLDKLTDFNVFVDTDSLTLRDALLQRYENISVHMRSPHLIGDEVSVCDIITDVINCYGIEGHLMQLHVTSPFLSKDVLDKAFEIIASDNYDSVVACNLIQSRLWRYDNNIPTPVNHNPAKLEQTQDLVTLYEENSAFYLLSVEDFLKTNMRVGTNPYFYNLKFPQNLDIDTEDDWDLCCKVLEILK